MARPIAVVDDELDILELVQQTLKKEGLPVRTFTTGDGFLNALQKEKPQFDLILLDIMLPGFSGIEILKLLRNNPSYSAYSSTPVILVSARDSETDRVLGLELGSDDYISKPFSPRELAARVKAVMRRTKKDDGPSADLPSRIVLGGLEIDEKRFQVYCDGQPVELTTAEFKLLAMMARRKGWVFERSKIIDSLWGGEKYVTDRTIDVHVKHLREKLGRYGELVRTVRGIGYKLDDQE